ncbi:MAG: hypothetical protein J0I06_26840 [Planctomycetes bacterium]|nr:hypothetical protein [Planctomycetota bacterium]
MAERVFCIDFGSAYTKVALRRDPTADSSLLHCGGAEVDFWIPTVVLVDRRGTEPKLEFGDRAAGRAAGGGIDVYTDFKRHLFTAPAPADGTPPLAPLDALLQSAEFAALATKYEVNGAQVAALRQLAGAARTLIGGPGARVVSAEAHRQANAAKLAFHYFNWLRRQVLDACSRLPATGLKFEDIPVRVSVPALIPGADVAQHPGCKLLREALHRAGWPLHPELPFVSEPESNAVGVLTKAGNVLTRGGRIHLGEMFSKGPLITVLKGDPNHPTYRALVIDVGAYTTDFASLFVKTDGKNATAETGAGFAVQQRSVPVGVTGLDASVRESLSPEKREWLAALPHKDFENFQRLAYTEGKGARAPGLGTVGGDADRDAMHSCLSDFARRIVDEAMTFCSALGPANMQELILTGGGSSIPTVRDALIAATQSGGNTFVKTHAPELKRGKAGAALVDKLDRDFTRGGSALGGASIYFEKAYY